MEWKQIHRIRTEDANDSAEKRPQQQQQKREKIPVSINRMDEKCPLFDFNQIIYMF